MPVITRTAITDDSGTGTDGTVINNAWKQELYDQIDDAVNPREQTVASAATVTPSFDTADIVTITAQAAALVLANPSPVTTVTQGSKLIIRIKDNGTGRAITYGTQYRALGNALPTTTVANKTMYLGLMWNATDTKWDLVACVTEA